MAEEFLEDIYKEAMVIVRLKQIIAWIRIDDVQRAVEDLNALFPQIIHIMNDYQQANIYDAGRICKLLEKISQESLDRTILADLLEAELIPCLERYMKSLGQISVEDDNGLELLSSESGFLALRDTRENVLFHSRLDPMWEAKMLAKTIFDPKKRNYALLGCGLGYLPYQLYLISNGSAVIQVFERDQVIAEYAKTYGVLDWIPRNVLNMTVDEDIISFLNCAEKENTVFYISPKELDRMPNEIKDIMKKICINNITERMMHHDEAINFWRNISCGARNVSELKKSLDMEECKEYIVVAGGPSLDQRIDWLKEQKGKKRIIAVGTVFKKLLEKGIEPDIVTVLDPQKRTLRQFEGVMDRKIPLLISLTAYWEFAEAYQGKKYIVPLDSSLQEVADYAKNRQQKVWKFCGTVTALAMEAAVYFGAKRIYLIGVDLAYPNGYTHALGTMDRRKISNTEELLEVERVGGGKVMSTAVFDLYRRDMEDMIAENTNIHYYNMSQCGARIKGTLEITTDFMKNT